MKALAGADSLFEIVVVMAIETFVAIDGTAVIYVAIVAPGLVVQPSVLFGQRSRRRRKESTLGIRGAASQKTKR